MVQSYLLSFAAACFMFFAALYELLRTLEGISTAEPPLNLDIVEWWLPLQIVVALAFLVRIFLVWNVGRISYAWIGASFVVSVSLSWFYFTSMFPNSGRVVYSMFDQGLASWMIGFFVFSFLRFVVTLCIAVAEVFSDEFSSYS